MNGFWTYAGLALSCAGAGILQTLCGFGGGVVIVLYLTQFMVMTGGSAMTLSICAFLSTYLLIRFIRKVEWNKKVVIPMIFYALMSLAVNWLLKRLSGNGDRDSINAVNNVLGLLFGVFQILLSVYYLFFTKSITGKGSFLSGAVCGGVSGVTASMFGVGGPFLSIYMLPVASSMESYTANMQLVFTVTNVFIITDKIRSGFYSPEMLSGTLTGGAGVLIGATLGIWLLKKIDPEKMKKVVYIFLGISGIITMIQYAKAI